MISKKQLLINSSLVIFSLIIGAGVVGLAIAERLSKENSCLLIERNPSFGMETSSRNSEVIHAGIYYPTDSLKAKLCVRGNSLMYKYLEENKLPFRRCGKYIIATKLDELEKPNFVFKDEVCEEAPEDEYEERVCHRSRSAALSVPADPVAPQCGPRIVSG